MPIILVRPQKKGGYHSQQARGSHPDTSHPERAALLSHNITMTSEYICSSGVAAAYVMRYTLQLVKEGQVSLEEV